MDPKCHMKRLLESRTRWIAKNSIARAKQYNIQPGFSFRDHILATPIGWNKIDSTQAAGNQPPTFTAPCRNSEKEDALEIVQWAGTKYLYVTMQQLVWQQLKQSSQKQNKTPTEVHLCPKERDLVSRHRVSVTNDATVCFSLAAAKMNFSKATKNVFIGVQRTDTLCNPCQHGMLWCSESQRTPQPKVIHRNVYVTCQAHPETKYDEDMLTWVTLAALLYHPSMQ